MKMIRKAFMSNGDLPMSKSWSKSESVSTKQLVDWDSDFGGESFLTTCGCWSEHFRRCLSWNLPYSIKSHRIVDGKFKKF